MIADLAKVLLLEVSANICDIWNDFFTIRSGEGAGAIFYAAVSAREQALGVSGKALGVPLRLLGGKQRDELGFMRMFGPMVVATLGEFCQTSTKLLRMV